MGPGIAPPACHFDGLVLQILERPEDPNEVGWEPNVLHIDLGPFSADIPVADLAAMDRVAEIDATGNVFQITGFAMLDIVECAKGFVSGSWRPIPVSVDTTPADEDRGEHLGNFAGRWMDQTGLIRGFLRGGYGLDTEGQPGLRRQVHRTRRFLPRLPAPAPGSRARTETDFASFSGGLDQRCGYVGGSDRRRGLLDRGRSGRVLHRPLGDALRRGKRSRR